MAFALGAMCLVRVSVAQAQVAAEDEVVARTRWIERQLHAQAPAGNRWYWTWFSLSAASAFGQSLAGAVLDERRPDGTLPPLGEQRRPGLFVGAVNTLVGWVPLLLFPSMTAFGAYELSQVSGGRDASQRMHRLREAERLLFASADGARFNRSWVIHGLGLVLGIGSSVVLAAAFQQPWWSVIGNGLVVVGLNEIQMLTTPMGLATAADRYRAGAWRSEPVASPRGAVAAQPRVPAAPSTSARVAATNF